jgi:asparaginyl-tRNA synthetase
LRLRSQVLSSATQHFEENGFIQTHPPVISSSDCEGAGEVFTVEVPGDSKSKEDQEHFFRTPKYLTVSSQLHLEALAHSVGNVWTISPTFRAEESDTPRHLSEFYMLEVESLFTKDLDSVMDTVEHMLQAIASRLLGSRLGQELLSAQESRVHNPTNDVSPKQDLESRWLGLQSGNWPRIPYTDAVSILRSAVDSKTATFDFDPRLGSSLQAEHERYLAERVGNGGPVFVTHYPRDIKAFYMSPSPGATPDLETVACFDLMVPELCEIVGGSLREHRIEPLLDSMERLGMLKDAEGADSSAVTDRLARVPENLRWYVDLRKFGSVPHGGFGLGFDRLLCYLSGVSSIRDMVSFPRYYGKCDC